MENWSAVAGEVSSHSVVISRRLCDYWLTHMKELSRRISSLWISTVQF